MLLDAYDFRNFVFQLQFRSAYSMWDSSGEVARRLTAIWPKLEVNRAEPNSTVLTAAGVTVRTEVNQTILTLTDLKSVDAGTIKLIAQAVEVWRDELGLTELKRVSARVQYLRNYPSLRAANAAFRAMQVFRWPTERVFDQEPENDKDSLEFAFRLEDETTFTVVRCKSEHVRYEINADKEYFDDGPLVKERDRLVIDFDRGTKGPIDVGAFRAEAWLKGYNHVLRRDIEKVLGHSP